MMNLWTIPLRISLMMALLIAVTAIDFGLECMVLLPVSPAMKAMIAKAAVANLILMFPFGALAIWCWGRK